MCGNITSQRRATAGADRYTASGNDIVRMTRSPLMRTAVSKAKKTSAAKAIGICACGAVAIEIDVPAFWAWHDHSRASQRAQGCAYATYIGVWKSRMRIVKGAKSITRFEDTKAG